MSLLVQLSSRKDVLFDDPFQVFLDARLVDTEMIRNQSFNKFVLVSKIAVFGGKEGFNLGRSGEGPVKVGILLKVDVVIKIY